MIKTEDYDFMHKAQNASNFAAAYQFSKYNMTNESQSSQLGGGEFLVFNYLNRLV